jgi:hypothetical protein
MKQVKFYLLAVLGIATPIMAAPFSTAQLQEASKIAIAEFVKDHADHADHITGYKVWKSGDDARVKIYVGSGASAVEFNFTCHIHGDELECHGQH